MNGDRSVADRAQDLLVCTIKQEIINSIATGPMEGQVELVSNVLPSTIY